MEEDRNSESREGEKRENRSDDSMRNSSECNYYDLL